MEIIKTYIIPQISNITTTTLELESIFVGIHGALSLHQMDVVCMPYSIGGLCNRSLISQVYKFDVNYFSSLWWVFLLLFSTMFFLFRVHFLISVAFYVRLLFIYSLANFVFIFLSLFKSSLVNSCILDFYFMISYIAITFLIPFWFANLGPTPCDS